jgi:hypothetical protein
MRRLRMRRVTVATVACVAALLLPSPPQVYGRDAEPTAPHLVDVTLSRTSVAVARSDMVPVTVEVRLTHENGVPETADVDGLGAPWPAVVLSKVTPSTTAGAPSGTYRDLDRTSGTARDGVWSAEILVPATYHGRWQVTRVIAAGDQGLVLDVDPREIGMTRTLSVAGSHVPRLSFGFAPDPVVGNYPSVDVKGRITDSDTGAPMSGMLLTLGAYSAENCGAFGWGGSAATTTNAMGYYSFDDLAPDEGYYCVIQSAPPRATDIAQWRTTIALFRRGSPRIQPIIAARAERTPVRIGESVDVIGRVTPLHAGICDGCGPERIFLERYVGGTWRRVESSLIRASGRYTLTATPPSVGNHRYRVFLPGRFTILPAHSRVVLIGAK